MKILILTQYYPPEIGAPQNRLHELAVRLKSRGIEVEVLTAQPNYPKMEIFEGYRNGEIMQEEIEGITVYRSSIYVSGSKSIVARLRNYFSFVWSSYKRGSKLGAYDFLLVESPPLFLGYSAMRLVKKLNAKLIFNVSDLWPESAEKLGIVSNKWLLAAAYRLEKKCYKTASLVTGQTQGIVRDINSRFPDVKTFWLPNGVDPDFYDPEHFDVSGFRERNGFHEQDILFFYGGILGYAQGLTLLLEAAAEVHHPDVKIVIQGTGPEEEKLKKLKTELGLNNVVFLPPVQKKEMPYVLREVDVAIVPLRKLELFQGAIPSKIFEALAMKKALLLGVEGEAYEHFITKAHAGIGYTPEDKDDLIEKINTMAESRARLREYGENGRRYVIDHFNRNKIAQDLIVELERIK